MSDIRFIDSLNVGAYTIDNSDGGGSGSGVNILAIGGAPSGTARLEVYHTGSVDNLILIRNADTNTGIKVDNTGRFQLLEFASLPTPIEGGIVYSSNEFYIGI